jgi:hypothetical protein
MVRTYFIAFSGRGLYAGIDELPSQGLLSLRELYTELYEYGCSTASQFSFMCDHLLVFHVC